MGPYRTLNAITSILDFPHSRNVRSEIIVDKLSSLEFCYPAQRIWESNLQLFG